MHLANRPSRRSSRPFGRPGRLTVVLLTALLMMLAQQAPARAFTEPGLYDFSMSISGPSALGEYDDATYTAVPAHGTAPYTYTWFRNGVQVGTGATYSVHLVRSGFTLRVDAVDANGNRASATLSVSVARECRTC